MNGRRVARCIAGCSLAASAAGGIVLVAVGMWATRAGHAVTAGQMDVLIACVWVFGIGAGLSLLAISWPAS